MFSSQYMYAHTHTWSINMFSSQYMYTHTHWGMARYLLVVSTKLLDHLSCILAHIDTYAHTCTHIHGHLSNPFSATGIYIYIYIYLHVYILYVHTYIHILFRYGAMYWTVVSKALELVTRITERLDDEQHDSDKMKLENTLQALVNLRDMLVNAKQTLMNRYIKISLCTGI